MDIKGKRIAILATNGFEQSELEIPRDRLKSAGATVEIVSLAAGEIKGWDKKDWGRAVKVDKTLDQASASDYDAIVLPGGQINPDLLRVEPKALKFIKDIFDAKKVVAAVCHGRPGHDSAGVDAQIDRPQGAAQGALTPLIFRPQPTARRRSAARPLRRPAPARPARRRSGRRSAASPTRRA
jgi:hypothetical protein